MIQQRQEVALQSMAILRYYWGSLLRVIALQQDAGCAAILVGESLVKQDDISAAVKALMS